MYREHRYASRNHERRKPVGRCVFPLALSDGASVAAERRNRPDRRRAGYESPLQPFQDIPAHIVQELLESCPVVREFTSETVVLRPGQAQSDDITAMAIRLPPDR